MVSLWEISSKTYFGEVKCKILTKHFKPTDINKIPEKIVHAFVQSLNVTLYGEMHLGTYEVRGKNFK